MRKAIIVLIIVAILSTCDVSHGATSDKQLATEWVNSHGGGYTIEKIITKAQGGKKGKVVQNGKVTKWTVKYPKKAKRGKKVTVYIIWDTNGEAVTMVCMGKVK